MLIGELHERLCGAIRGRLQETLQLVARSACRKPLESVISATAMGHNDGYTEAEKWVGLINRLSLCLWLTFIYLSQIDKKRTLIYTLAKDSKSESTGPRFSPNARDIMFRCFHAHNKYASPLVNCK